MAYVLTKEQIQASQDIGQAEVQVPEWGGSVFVKALANDASTEFEQYCADRSRAGKITLDGVKVQLVIRSACNHKGEPLFAGADAAWLEKKSAAAINRLFQKAQELNGYSKADIQDLAGNSPSAPA